MFVVDWHHMTNSLGKTFKGSPAKHLCPPACRHTQASSDLLNQHTLSCPSQPHQRLTSHTLYDRLGGKNDHKEHIHNFSEVRHWAFQSHCPLLSDIYSSWGLDYLPRPVLRIYISSLESVKQTGWAMPKMPASLLWLIHRCDWRHR